MPVADLLPQIPPLALIDRRFVVEAPIGADGMASVYRARDRLTGKIVALKLVTLPEGDSFVRLRGREAPVVEREVTVASDGATRAPTGVPAKIDPNATVASVDDPAVAPNVDLDDARRRALRLLAIIQEFKLLSGLRHPNVINVYDYGVDGGQPYFTMELLEGAKTITEVAWTLPRPERVRLLVQVLAALQYLHRHDLLHRDIKPGNVLVVGDRVQVLDFGVSVRRDRVTDIAGTTLYMAPEVLRGNPPTASSDLYGFGVMAFEALVGVRPFGLEDPRSIEIDFELLLSEPETRVDARTGGSEQEPRPRSAVVRSSQPRSSQRDSNTRRRMPPTDRLHVVLSRLLSVSMRGRYESARDVMEDLCAAIGDPPPFEDATIRESYLQAAPLVGRASELRRLDLALTSARESKGDAFVVVGESGVGKSRLVDELRTRCAVSGAEVVRGQALREGNAPFQIFREPVRQLALRAGVADEDATLLKVVAPDLARILDRPISPPPPIDPAILHQQIIGAVLKLLTRSDRPIVLILEDLHWMQDDSAMLLARCAAASRGSRLLIVALRATTRLEI